MKIEDSIKFIKDMGDNFKKFYNGYDCWVFSGDLESLKHLGLKTSRKIKLFNAAIECRLNKYQIY